MPIHICSINSFHILMEYDELEQIRQKTKKRSSYAVLLSTEKVEGLEDNRKRG